MWVGNVVDVLYDRVMESEQTGTRRKLISVVEDVEIVSKSATFSMTYVFILSII